MRFIHTVCSLITFHVGLHLGNPSSRDERYGWGNTISGPAVFHAHADTEHLWFADIRYRVEGVRNRSTCTSELQVHICGLVGCVDTEKPRIGTALSW